MKIQSFSVKPFATGASAALLLFTGCQSSGNASSQQRNESAAAASIHVQQGPTSIPAGSRAFSTDALLYVGDGSWGVEVDALEGLLDARGATYQKATSSELERMSAEEMAKFGAFVWPGGSGGQMSSSLSTQAKATIRRAVQELGVGFVGFCAGSFVAVAPAPAEGEAPSYGIGLVDGPELGYYRLEEELTRAGRPDLAMTMESFADGSKRDLLWYGGPVVPSAPGIVVAKYPTGEAAISQLWSGNGWVVLSAVHPSVPQSVRDEYGLKDSDGLDLELAWQLVDGAIHQKPMAVFAE